MSTLPERIRETRLARGMSQGELAEKAGYTSRASINKIEKGLVDVPRSKLFAIAKALGVSPAWLLGFPEELPEVPPLPELTDITPALEAMQAIYDKHRALFDAADNATPEEIKQAADYLEFLKSQR